METASALRGWHSRGYHLHFDGSNYIQFVTFRTHLSLPREQWLSMREKLSPSEIETFGWDAELDRSLEGRFLQSPGCSEIIIETLKTGATRGDFDLFAFVVMCNHVHLLLSPCGSNSLSTIVQSVKSISSRRIKSLLGGKDPVWSPDYFDRYIRDQDHFDTTKRYIEMNPVSAGLVRRPEDWAFSSFELD